ncbi:transposase [Mycobacterium tuberculosis variant bovis]|uniref:PROBABLE TRANSPOSASE [FIRST PART] n=2 Tax=Mycobacterium bovis TaxID=1765 RepID=A0A1R3Y137_MYCBO|nr:transposase [Mycobacterium tuberculosis]AET19708.1 Putative transposase [Mycobacterium tuberculosis variant bovis BCG str. Mexico]AGE68426.1 transposase [Mycobacterium tuberculosis variant bovis BCG str. Korea 1168P]AHM08175.1 Mobile element protein [Mycobacterium tuberculosis variant bovis BCG str. ATCC 35743]AMO10855.1 transposase [Mycobacterium tuberculosis variant bovis BCG str. Tokyo 172]ESK71581.1 transposase IS1558 [Mycobacterium tuberculosis variant bovis AN5]ESK75535.1 transposase
MQCRAREERPGRKTDLLDAEWLVHLLECGLLRGWLIPPADIKAARDVIRYRRKLVEHRTSKLQRLGNASRRRDQGRQRGVLGHPQVGAGDGGGAHRR